MCFVLQGRHLNRPSPACGSTTSATYISIGRSSITCFTLATLTLPFGKGGLYSAYILVTFSSLSLINVVFFSDGDWISIEVEESDVTTTAANVSSVVVAEFKLVLGLDSLFPSDELSFRVDVSNVVGRISSDVVDVTVRDLSEFHSSDVMSLMTSEAQLSVFVSSQN